MSLNVLQLCVLFVADTDECGAGTYFYCYQAEAPEPLGTKGHVPLHFGKWLGTGGHRKGNESRIKETLLDQVWLLTRLLLVATTSVTAERSFLAFRRLKHTCELRWASLD